MELDTCWLQKDAPEDLFSLIAGTQLGWGQYRRVYEHQFDKKLVIKQDSGQNFSNINEWMVWLEFKDSPLGQWLAPVHFISPRGLWIVMGRTRPIPIGKFPKRIPALFADIKPENWGMYRGRPVCHDYGNHSVFSVARPLLKKMKPALWEHHV
ncbi:MAG: hypothetical protein V4614_14970 [Pseudomonadota bacterium]